MNWILIFVLLPQETDAERLKRLEEQVKKQQAEIDELKKQKEKKDEGDITATFTDGLRFKSKDGNFDVHLGGRFQEHVRVVLDRPDGSRTSPDTFFIRAARLQIDGTLWKEFGFIVQADFPSSSTGPSPTIQAAYLEWKRFDWLHLYFGQFKAPASQETLTSTRFIDFVERSPLSRFVPSYEIGIQAHGKLWEGAFAYFVAVTNGRSHLADAGRSRHDDNDEKEFLARVTASPWIADKESFLRGLRFGVYGSITDTDDVALATNFDISSPELGVTFLDSTVGFFDGRRTRIGFELSYAYGPVSFRAEYLLREDEAVNGALEEDLETDAWYAALTWIVTGEDKIVETRITPTHPLDLEEGEWGAFELALRVSGAEVADGIDDVGTSLATQSNEITTVTFGVNWYPVKNVRISANVVFEDYHDDIDFGGGREEDRFVGFLLRFQIDL